MKDARADGNDILAERKVDRVALVQRVNGLKRKATEFLERFETGDKKAFKNDTKRPRTKALEWLYCTHRILSSYVSIVGWLWFVISPFDFAHKNPVLWPRCTLTSDRGPDCTSALWWLLAHRVNVDVRWDKSHVRWAAVKLTLKHCGLWQHVLLMCTLLSLHYKPYTSSEYWCMLKEYSQDFTVLKPCIAGCSSGSGHSFAKTAVGRTAC